VKTAEETDKTRPPRHITRQFEGAFNALRTGLRKETHRRLPHGRNFGNTFAETDLRLVPIIRRNMQEILRRIGHGCDHLRMTVTSATDGDAGDEI